LAFVASGGVLSALHAELGLSATSDHAVPNRDTRGVVVIVYHVDIPLMEERRFPRYPFLELEGWLEVRCCLDNVWRDVRTNVPHHAESQWKAVVARVNCIATHLLVVIIFQFELLNLVGLIDVCRGSLWCFCSMAASSQPVLAEQPT